MRASLRPGPKHSATPPPRGFTLPELLVAIVLIDIGVLALVACSTVVVRQADDLRRRGAAIRLASSRLELLGVLPCAATQGSDTSVPGLREHWSVALLQNGIRELSDSVVYTVSGSSRSGFALRTKLPC